MLKLPCPSCSVTCKFIAKTPSSGARVLQLPRRRPCRRVSSLQTSRGFASSSANIDSEYLSSPKVEPLTLLYKTTKLLPRVRDYKSALGLPRPVVAGHFWDSILSKAYEDLSANLERPANILVYGLDEWSGSQELVTALLANPLSEKDRNDALNNRWSDSRRQKVEISYGTNSDAASNNLKFPSTYLTQFPIPIEISELRPPSASSDPIGQMLGNTAIFEADIVIIVCNPLTTSLGAILGAQLPQNTILVLTSTTSQAELNAIVQYHLSTSSPSRVINPANIIVADPGRAVQATKILQAEPTSLSAIQKFQDDYVGSQLSNVTRALQSQLMPTQDSILVRRKLAMRHIGNALHWSLANTDQVQRDLDKAFLDINLFKEGIEEALAMAEGQVFGKCTSSYNGELVLESVADAIMQAEKEIRPITDSLTWWRMTWKVDEISSIIGTAITQSWCRDLTKKLTFYTGTLSALQNEISESALSLLSAQHTISTAVLQNSVLQRKTSSTHHLTPETLTQPILSRRNQLIEYPTMRLHVSGQRAVLGMTSGILSGVGISWAGWMGWLLGSGEGLFGFVGMNAETSVGVGILTAVASIRWAIGKWEKSKKRWWQDWARVGGGLSRDLKATLHKTMHQQVVVMGEMACEGMLQSIRAREEDLAQVNADLQEIQAGLNGVVPRLDQKS